MRGSGIGVNNEAERQPFDPVVEWQSALDGGSFEETYTSLEEVVARLEQGGLPLETSLAYYELGVRLGERCAHLLEQAELRVSQLEQIGRFNGDTEVWHENGDGDSFA